MKIVLAQINPTVGDILGNYKKIVTNISKYNNKADLIVFPELSISGYPLEDLVLKDRFLYEITYYCQGFVYYSMNFITFIIKHMGQDLIGLCCKT